MIARAVAGEANVPFFNLSGADFVEMFVGVGASRVRDLFEQGKQNQPCIIFIDELDAVGRQRGAGLGGGHDEREQTLNALLVEMDGFEANENIIVMAATNRPDVLDAALLRPGRFDRQIVVDVPDLKGRLGILEVHTKKIVLNKKDINLEDIAKGTPGMVGADLENIVNEVKQFEAVIRTPGRKGYFQPDNDILKNTWFFVEPKLMSDYLQIPFVNEIYLEAVSNGPGGYPIGNQTRIYLRNNHLQYAITWFILSLFALITRYLLLYLRANSKNFF